MKNTRLLSHYLFRGYRSYFGLRSEFALANFDYQLRGINLSASGQQACTNPYSHRFSICDSERDTHITCASTRGQQCRTGYRSKCAGADHHRGSVSAHGASKNIDRLKFLRYACCAPGGSSAAEPFEPCQV